MRDRSPVPAGIDLMLIDDAALDGAYRLIFGGEFFAVARAIDGAWHHSSGVPVSFAPTHYHVAQNRG